MNDEDMQKKLDTEQINLAPFGKRFLAFLVDEILISFLIFIAFSGSFENAKTLLEMINITNSIFFQIVLILIFYQGIFVALYGATLGKMLFKIKIINIYYLDKPSFAYSFLRAIVRILSSFFYLGYIFAFLNPQRQTWQDKIAKTWVVNA